MVHHVHVDSYTSRGQGATSVVNRKAMACARRPDALQTETCTRCIHVPGYTTHTQLTQAFHAQKIDTKDKKQRAVSERGMSSEFRVATVPRICSPENLRFCQVNRRECHRGGSFGDG